MSKVVQRLITFFIGLPLVIGLVFLEYFNHLPINALACIASAIASAELYSILLRKTSLLPKWLVIILATSLPLISYALPLYQLHAGLDFTTDYSHWIFLIAAMILMATEVFLHKTYEESNLRLSASVFIVFYCGFMFTFITRMTLLQHATYFLALFLFTVFITDSFAWLFGVLLGKNNRNIFAASPNKSLAGFIGGYFGAILSCVLAQIFLPEVFSGGLYKAVILGLCSASASIVGDLIESVFKRSSGIKDSGSIIPGRGGILDSVDSILFTAPIFYVISFIFYNPQFITQ